MKPARFEYVAPTTLDAAVEALAAADGEGKFWPAAKACCRC